MFEADDKLTSYESYFTISDSYAQLFYRTKHVWDALRRLPSFLETNKGKGLNSEASFIDNSAYVHPTATIKNSYIGAGARIYEGVVIRDSIIGSETVIGHSSEIARSIVLEYVSIPRFDYIGASIIGNSVRFGGMIACASRRFDSQEITIRVRGRSYQTEFKKLGSVIGDNSMLGFGVHCNPGTLIGPDTLIMPHVEVQGFVPANSLVIVHQRQKILRRQSLTGLIAALDDEEA
jgi:UDP-N-acetylglucosamine diphosphorylase / glucose-1-phosphate thymidylyltransferase / UDP-N-acetylgalactosamine diphosphorylase / glucosamine-1-phosphate N-acetyltransferase / galactosamine-1-phosphate N-acetyltransferase